MRQRTAIEYAQVNMRRPLGLAQRGKASFSLSPRGKYPEGTEVNFSSAKLQTNTEILGKAATGKLL